MKEKIREALDKVESANWERSYFGDGTPYMSIMGNDCVNVAENSPTWLRWQNERIEQLEKAFEDLSTDGIAVEEATHEELCEFIASMKKRIDQAIGREE